MRSSLLLSFLPGLVQCTRLHIFAQNTNALATASILPSSTTASLTTTGHVLHAHLNTDNVFDFGNVSAGSYLLDVHAHTHVFAPLRVDVHQVAAQSEDPEVEVWGTFRGNEWGNKGEKLEVRRLNEKAKGRQDIWGFAVNAVGKKEYLMDRQGFSPLAILKSPMILIALGSLAIVFGMPYLMDNMDPELRAEFEERQKSNPLAGGQAANPLQDFDPAAWLAGNSGTKRESSVSTKNQAAERGVTR